MDRGRREEALLGRLPLTRMISTCREFRFTSEVPIWLDYHGKHVTVDQVVSSQGRENSISRHCKLIQEGRPLPPLSRLGEIRQTVHSMKLFSSLSLSQT